MEFTILLNTIHENIKFTMEYRHDQLPLLDILIKKISNKIETYLHHTPSDWKQYLRLNSCHPRHTRKNVNYNLTIRLCTIVSDAHILIRRLQEINTTLISNTFQRALSFTLKNWENLKPNRGTAQEVCLHFYAQTTQK